MLFLVDTYCRGVKDCFGQFASALAIGEFVENMRGKSTVHRCSPETARRLVEDSVAFAMSCGLRPHRDYLACAALFGDIDPLQAGHVFPMGCDGKPRYISGPFEPPHEVERVLQKLTQTQGPDGFTFLVPMHPNEEMHSEFDDGFLSDDDEFVEFEDEESSSGEVPRIVVVDPGHD
ncbi:MAG: hypothetical protein KDA96_20575 [Planctomycetaceae bacterium]|nr:hypothetical protein [Planctomycetaceae bacterium]